MMDAAHGILKCAPRKKTSGGLYLCRRSAIPNSSFLIPNFLFYLSDEFHVFFR